MITRDLVCNYFERNGSFSGIETTCIGAFLCENARKCGSSLEELCYRIVGYKDKKEFENKVAVIRGDESVLPVLGFSSLKEAADGLGIGRLRKVKKPVSRLKVNGIPGLDFLVAEFYKNDLTNVVCGKGCYTLLPFWLFSHVNSSVETVLNDEEVRKCFVHFACAPCKKPVILNKTLYTRFEIGSGDREAINKEAIRLALHKGEGAGWFYKMRADELLFLSGTDKETYKNLLEYAAATGHTYAGLLRTRFVEIPDFIGLYKNLQCIFYKFGSKVAYRKGDSWIFSDAFHFLSDTVSTLTEPLDAVDLDSCQGEAGKRGSVDAIHCF